MKELQIGDICVVRPGWQHAGDLVEVVGQYDKRLVRVQLTTPRIVCSLAGTHPTLKNIGETVLCFRAALKPYEPPTDEEWFETEKPKDEPVPVLVDR